MNRAILIVICDFLVSAMLAMMTGMVPAHSGGTGVGLDETTTKLLLSELDNHRAELEKLRSRLRETIEKLGTSPEREAELRRLAAALAANRSQREKLLITLNATPENTGKLTEAELKKRLEAEQQKRYTLEIELRDNVQNLSRTREKLADRDAQLRATDRDLAVNRRELSRTRDALAKTSEALVDMTKTQVETKTALAKAEAKVETKNAEIALNKEQLAGAQQQLRNISATLSRSQSESKTLQGQLAFTTGQLRTREKDYAGLQDKLSRIEQQNNVEKLKRAEAEIQLKEMEKTVKQAIHELSAARTELGKVTVEKTKAEATLQATEKFLKESSLRRNEVLSCYSNSIVKFTYFVAEKRLLGEQSGQGTLYLPVVDFNGRNLIIGTVNKFAGDADTALSFQNVSRLDFFASPIAENAVQHQLTTPMLIDRRNWRTAAFAYPGKERTPLKVITLDRLKKRGLDDLYLFKSRSLGKESALLDGRCSIMMEPGLNAMFIRNAGRANNELAAEPGDIIISKEGEFAGIVIDRDASPDGKVRGARAQLFADSDFLKSAYPVKVTDFAEYSAKMRDIRGKYKADSRRK